MSVNPSNPHHYRVGERRENIEASKNKGDTLSAIVSILGTIIGAPGQATKHVYKHYSSPTKSKENPKENRPKSPPPSRDKPPTGVPIVKWPF